MTDASTPPHVPARAPRRLLRAMLVAVAAGVLALGALVWALARGPGVQWVAARAVQASAGRLAIEGIEGTVLGELRAARVVWDDPAGTRVVVHDGVVRWRTWPLLRRALHVKQFEARRIDVDSPPSEGPPALPASLALPFAVHIDQAKVDVLALGTRGPTRAGEAAGVPLQLTGIALQLAYRPVPQEGTAPPDDPGPPGVYRIGRLALNAPWGSVEASGQVADQQPFAAQLAGRVVARPGAGIEDVVAQVTAAGPLEALDAQVSAEVREAVLQARTRVTPFAAEPVGRIDFEARGLSLRRFAPAAPDARLALTGHVEPSLAALRAPAGAGWLVGEFEARNALPGAPADARLPVDAARAAFVLARDRLRVDRLQVALSDGARIDGRLGLALDAPPAGAAGRGADAEGIGEVARWLQRVEGELAVRGLDLSTLARGLVSTRLDGTVRAQRGLVAIDLKDGGRLLDGGLGLRAQLGLAAQVLRIEAGELSAREGTLRVAGTVGLGEPWRLALEGTAERFDTRRWLAAAPEIGGRAWQARLSGTWKIDGSVRPALDLRLASVLRDSTLNGKPLAGSIRVALAGPAAGASPPQDGPIARVHEVALELGFGTTRIEAQGSLGAPGDRLAFALQSRALAELDPRLAGRLEASGSLHDRLLAPGIRLKARGTGLGFQGEQLLRAVSLDADVDVTDLREGRVSADLRGTGLQGYGYLLDNASASVTGTAAGHTLRVAGFGAGQRLQASGEGRLTIVDGQPAAWTLRLASLETGGALQLLLRAPATLTLSPGRVAVEGLDTSLAGGRLVIASGRLERGQFAARGEFDGLGVDRLLDSVERVLPGRVDPAIRRGADIGLRGRFELAGSGPDDLGGSLELDAQSRQVAASSRLRLTVREGALAGTLHLELPSLRWLRSVIGDEWRADGALAFDGEVGGRLRAPRLAGDLSGRDLRFEQQLLGWRLRDGVLAARFEGDRLRIERLRFASSTGSVTLQGALALPGGGSRGLDLGTGDFDLRAERLPLSIAPGQRVVLSGATRIQVEHDRMRWTGRLVADEGLLELKDFDAPVQPSDLEIVDHRPGRTPARAAPATPNGTREGAAGRTAPGPRVATDLELDLGEHFRVTGGGVEARLQGAIRLAGELPDAPRATGTVQIRDGRYIAYGQPLEIERGRLVFNGALDNPVIDIVAVRRYLPVEAGVALSGTAQSPRVRLVSTPEVADAEKLSWLVLGVGLEDAGSASQVLALQTAAGSLFGAADGGRGSVSQMLGLDVVGVRSASSTGSPSALPSSFGSQSTPGLPGSSASSASTSGTQQNVVTFGKRLSSRLYVSYEQGIRGVWNLLRIQYDISNRLSVRALTGSESAIDLLYFHPFD